MRASREIALTSAISHLECIVNSNDDSVDSATRSLAGLDYALSIPTTVSLSHFAFQSNRTRDLSCISVQLVETN